MNARITTELSTRREHGYVVTLDDITDLVSAQRIRPGRMWHGASPMKSRIR
ncbi:hypothetical protein V6L77_23590 [Pannonibacter sp. Pt2-lr]